MIMKRVVWVVLVVLASMQLAGAKENNEIVRKIEVNGAATVSIVPDRITVEIGMQEYFRKKGANDSVKVTLGEIEKQVRKAFTQAAIADSSVRVSGIGNYSYHTDKNDFLNAKQLQATLTDMWQLDKLSESLNFGGISWFRIAQLDNSQMEKYNRQGLKAALDKARDKAAFIAANEGGTLGAPITITEDGPLYYEEAMTTNVALDAGAGAMMKAARVDGLESMKKIVRRYNVRVTYDFIPAGV